MMMATIESGSNTERPAAAVLKIPWNGATSGSVSAYMKLTNAEAVLAPNILSRKRIAIRISIRPTTHQTTWIARSLLAPLR